MAVKDLFQPDNLFSEVMTKIFDILLLNMLWLICSLPVVTFGASTTALYYVMMKLVRDEENGIVKSFFKSFRDNFRQSLPVTALFALVFKLGCWPIAIAMQLESCLKVPLCAWRIRDGKWIHDVTKGREG